MTSIAGYRDIASVTGSNGGHTVTVKFKKTFADWQVLFDNLVPAHVMEKVGLEPDLPDGRPRPSTCRAGRSRSVGLGRRRSAGAEPEVVGHAGQRPLASRCTSHRRPSSWPSG